jgi:cytochrome c-type biogenesis protein CcmH/NrfF
MSQPTITVSGPGIQKSENLDISISIEVTVNINAATAEKKVTAWLVSEVGNLLIAGTPQLVISRQTLWRVPVLLTSSAVGIVGEVGFINVDAETGDLLIQPETAAQLLTNVRHITSATLSTVS